MEYSYEDDICITGNALDAIDILSLIEDDKMTVYQLMKIIDAKTEGMPLLEPDDFFEGCIFNRMNEDEFIDYLSKRYGKDDIRIDEVTTTYIKKLK